MYKKIITFLAIVAAILFLLLCYVEKRGEDSVEKTNKGTTKTLFVFEKAALPSTPKEQIEAKVEHMTLEEKVGQMFLVRCPEENVLEDISTYHLGGYIFFARDFKEKTKAQVTEAIQGYQAASKIPMLMSVDEEGGQVNRISIYPQFRAVPFWSSRALYQEGGWDLIESDTEEKCELLASLGLNVNMAPVCDVTTDASAYVYERTFGSDGEKNGEYVSRVVKVMRDKKIGSVLKHFPGYGNNTDTHSGISYDTRPYTTFEESDFLPFQAGIAAGAGAVLVSHNIISSMDPDWPASLSKEVHEILRRDLDFRGVIMTDDLYMDAIRKYTGKQEAAVKAVLAGNDMLCCTDYRVQIPAVIAAVEEGIIPESLIDQAVLRILMWRYSLGLVTPESIS